MTEELDSLLRQLIQVRKEAAQIPLLLKKVNALCKEMNELIAFAREPWSSLYSSCETELEEGER